MGVGHHVLQAGIIDLPGQPIAVLQPAAVALLAAGDERVPQPVDVLLDLAVDVERDRLVELEMGPAVDGDEILALELEGNRHDRALRPRAAIVIARPRDDARVLEDGGIEAHRLPGIGVEPQEWRDLCWIAINLLRLTVSDRTRPCRSSCRRARSCARARCATGRRCGESPGWRATTCRSSGPRRSCPPHGAGHGRTPRR